MRCVNKGAKQLAGIEECSHIVCTIKVYNLFSEYYSMKVVNFKLLFTRFACLTNLGKCVNTL